MTTRHDLDPRAAETDARDRSLQDGEQVRLSTAAPDAEFVQLFTRSQRPLYLHILTLVPHPADAEEILQETNLVVWRKVGQFRPGTNFIAWARQIATLEVLKFRDRKHQERLRFSDEFLERIAAENEKAVDEVDPRQKALSACLGKLRRSDRELIQQRYAPGECGHSIAKKLGRPANSVYQSLGRIRRILLDCVTRRMATEGTT